MSQRKPIKCDREGCPNIIDKPKLMQRYCSTACSNKATADSRGLVIQQAMVKRRAQQRKEAQKTARIVPPRQNHPQIPQKESFWIGASREEFSKRAKERELERRNHSTLGRDK